VSSSIPKPFSSRERGRDASWRRTPRSPYAFYLLFVKLRLADSFPRFMARSSEEHIPTYPRVSSGILRVDTVDAGALQLLSLTPLSPSGLALPGHGHIMQSSSDQGHGRWRGGP
jgi:hypothetical protein